MCCVRLRSAGHYRTAAAAARPGRVGDPKRSLFAVFRLVYCQPIKIKYRTPDPDPIRGVIDATRSRSRARTKANGLMGFPLRTAAGLAAVLVLSACSSLWPSTQAPESAARTTTVAPGGVSRFEVPAIAPGQPTGTAVGERVDRLRGELGQLQGQMIDQNARLQDLRAQVVSDAERYHGTVAAINARLQIGTTPGNPILVQQFNSASGDLDQLVADIAAMNQLATDVTASSNMAAYLSEATRATFAISGAIDEDHRQLAVLQDEVDRTAVLVDRLLTELSDEIRRQSDFVAVERGNLNAMASGIRAGQFYGGTLMQRGPAGALPAVGPPTSLGTSAARRPLMVIRFERGAVDYESTLYNAVSQTLDRRPNAAFDLVGVAPSEADPGRVALDTTKARRHADSVRRTLVDMGLPPTRVAVSTAVSETARVNEVRLYVR